MRERSPHEAVDGDVDARDGAGDRPAAEAGAQRPSGIGIRDRHREEGSAGAAGGPQTLAVGLVANPDSGKGDAGRVGDALRREGAAVRTLDFEAVCAGDDVDVDGLDRIVAAGGDGTVGPAARLASSTGLPLAVVATGTANSFARWLELPLDADDAARLAARPQAVLRTVEVADACGRPFVNVAATGLSVLAAHGARPLKKPLGPAAYAVGALRAGLTGRPLHTAVRCDGELAWRGDAWQVLVAATGAFGGDSATGGVDTADRRLDVAIVPAGPRRRLAARALAMRRRELVHEHEVTHVRGRVVELELPAGHPFNVDGEILDLERARFSVLGTLRVVAW